MTKEIPLWCGDSIVGHATIDEDDFADLSVERWSLNPDGYAIRSRDGSAMHRLLLGCERGDGRIVDHKNRNRSDNRRCNLRVVSERESHANRVLAVPIGGAGTEIRRLKDRIAALEAERDFYFNRAYARNAVLRRDAA